jgi:histidine ammonia-lyase
VRDGNQREVRIDGTGGLAAGEHSGGGLDADELDAGGLAAGEHGGGGFGADAVRAIAAGARVTLAPALLDAVAAQRERVLAALADPSHPVYGVTTGMGAFAGRRLDPDEQASHQLRLLTARAVGGPPWLPVPDVRAVLAIVLRTALRPETGASAQLCRFLADRLDDGFHPAVPREGIGCAGEIIPLCHAGQTLTGLGTVLADDGTEVPAAEALAARGVEPYRPGPRRA